MCIYIYICLYLPLYMYLYVYVNVYVCIYTHMYVYIHSSCNIMQPFSSVASFNHRGFIDVAFCPTLPIGALGEPYGRLPAYQLPT